MKKILLATVAVLLVLSPALAMREYMQRPDALTLTGRNAISSDTRTIGRPCS